MNEWYRFHLDQTVTAVAVPDNRRFWVQVRSSGGGSDFPTEFYRWSLRDAQMAADRLIQAYYPHECDDNKCGKWMKSHE